MSSQSFFITGVSAGFGAEIAIAALKAGHKVVGTVRNRKRAAENVQRIESAGGKILELDVTQAEACTKVWQEAEQIYGHIDILCNNAGMSYLGALEDFTDEEARSQMEVNLYGPLRLIRAALPSFRARKSGTIVNITSIAGIDGLPSCSLYAASKFGLEGLSECLAREVADYNIHVLIVEPGAFRTNFLGAFVTNSMETLDAYPAAKNVIDRFRDVHGKQPGDPIKGAEAIVQVAAGTGEAGGLKGKVQRLPLGPDCYKRFEEKVKKLGHDWEAVREVALSTDGV
ncbi:uncharacterized protein MYCFIDRAFT_78895 [Pseudocercospora fijiensis CIRAD86]|uniref:Uncharacterized protein n=1 Tax=Pseudocercospora fijiensis (strain CIRAD86) TaxID=383855 RepID=M2YV97_PSEFD|nr:uncharacterized protein MYCFIDRAFT_78895 [Pseudocercospora fijiensis CIRAD86]EME81645.1 hypothetical protein MYCFIDRAFT_78895 [Pseudocercospora fijiensis CIRAD86]